MTIYLDYIFIENFVIDYILLKETSYIAKKEITNTRTIISAIIASVYVVAMLYFKIQQLNYIVCKLLLVVIIIYIAFVPKSISEYIKIVLLFFLMSIINVGSLTFIVNLLNIQIASLFIKLTVYMSSFVISRFVTQHMWKMYKRNIKDDDLIYEVKIKVGEKEYKYKAFLDTGNNVFSYVYDVPVIFAEIIDEEMVKNLCFKESFLIKTVTLSNTSDKNAYIFDKIEISKINKSYLVKAAIVFEDIKLSKDNNYNMLLNYVLYSEKLGGIKL